jgi:plasmid segregation protein ParM
MTDQPTAATPMNAAAIPMNRVPVNNPINNPINNAGVNAGGVAPKSRW